MRIAFHGKGGAGKTTSTALFVRFLGLRHPFVLAVDADLNAHLQEALQMEGEALYLGMCFDDICTYLAGQRQDLAGRPMICTTPPAYGSNFVRVRRDDPFIRKYALTAGNIALLTVGKYSPADVATTCYHEKLKSVMGAFHHMLDGPGDLVVVDTIAGTDNIATSLSFAFDLNVFVVEPSAKSLKVFRDYLDLVPEYADKLFVIANKVQDSSDEAFVRKHVPSESYLGALPFFENQKRLEQGDYAARSRLDEDLVDCSVFHELEARLLSGKRDWTAYLDRLRSTYRLDCQRWYSEFLHCDLEAGLDNNFSYEVALMGR